MNKHIALLDSDNDNVVYGVIIIHDDTTVEEVNKIFTRIRNEELPGDWCLDDLIQGLTDSGIDFEYDEGAHSISV